MGLAVTETARAWDALRARLPEERYQRHPLAVEAIMREMATPSIDNVDHWGLAGLLHDIDIGETSSDLSRHGVVGAQILPEHRFPINLPRPTWGLTSAVNDEDGLRHGRGNHRRPEVGE